MITVISPDYSPNNIKLNFINNFVRLNDNIQTLGEAFCSLTLPFKTDPGTNSVTQREACVVHCDAFAWWKQFACRCRTKKIARAAHGPFFSSGALLLEAKSSDSSCFYVLKPADVPLSLILHYCSLDLVLSCNVCFVSRQTPLFMMKMNKVQRAGLKGIKNTWRIKNQARRHL